MLEINDVFSTPLAAEVFEAISGVMIAFYAAIALAMTSRRQPIETPQLVPAE